MGELEADRVLSRHSPVRPTYKNTAALTSQHGLAERSAAPRVTPPPQSHVAVHGARGQSHGVALPRSLGSRLTFFGCCVSDFSFEPHFAFLAVIRMAGGYGAAVLWGPRTLRPPSPPLPAKPCLALVACRRSARSSKISARVTDRIVQT